MFRQINSAQVLNNTVSWEPYLTKGVVNFWLPW